MSIHKMTKGFVTLNECCNECLFSPDRIVSGQRAAEVIDSCKKSGAHFQCHKATLNGLDVACKGFVDTFHGHTPGMRFSKAMGLDRTVTVEDMDKFGCGEIDYDELVKDKA
jgi:hypothetical protein